MSSGAFSAAVSGTGGLAWGGAGLAAESRTDAAIAMTAALAGAGRKLMLGI